ncbi:probable RNA polymerase II nuclear localization protein SLC7A6OS [Heteronotia binoei]|uniref:probable RNA polymerase II nuclear localization protein SLC7A6OS n=1 Tax=Heteronotia binoei TaxID=13085 RepID=UPI00292E7511|nr:probable RNA polymerase II nuclear localization protein SLC7A6OS [Heteronotia binoei]XP_060110439.1 probable RNA polymerase II nuclear localization protein SLC7A6OS [Heteronotia binoei]XP_060110440.1 probable RNA polymerase II nuclear localization protein SLC7A6OS [Heteronotia binoei]XP_060110441.1 probable RNA polymerase II nuclear localization protein SLC7A6OS [Heteronotia binoei]
MERAAVLRVKRKRGGSAPAEALVLACKRLRTESEVADATASGDGVEKNLFKLVATVVSQDEPVQKYIQEAITKDKAAQRLRPSLGSTQRVTQDLRSSKQARRQESRYHLIASHRPNFTDVKSILPADGAESNESKQLAFEAKKDPSQEESHGPSGCCDEFQLFDIIQEENVEKDPGMPQKTDDPDVILCNAVEMIRERLTVTDSAKEAECGMKEDDYVYDIYYMETVSPGWIENILSVQSYTQDYELVDEECLPEEVYDDEDDENNENNWRNDYPDGDEFFEEDDSDREASGSSDEDSGYIRRTQEKYQADVLWESDYNGFQGLDSE